MNRAPGDRTRILILILFLLSGACTLIYEVVWVRMLIVVFGTSVYAVSTVLTAFMAGLALGSACFGRLVDRRGNGLRIYAWLELGIGLFALLLPERHHRAKHHQQTAYQSCAQMTSSKHRMASWLRR